MCKSLSHLVAAARLLVGEFDPGGLLPHQAAQIFSDASALERLAAALKVLATPKLKESEDWGQTGHRSAEEWMAVASGTSLGEARRVVETAERVAALPATAAAMRAGALSLVQTTAVAQAAAVAPNAEAELIRAAGSETVRALKNQARKFVLDSQGTIEERYERQRRLRALTHWIDDEGMVAGRFRLTPDEGSAIVQSIRREADRLFRHAHREGRRESSEACAADALVGLVVNGQTGSGKAKKTTEVVVVVSHAALRRGFIGPGTDELCEVPGFGAVPVSRAREMLADSFLKGVVVDGVRPTHVKHFGRHRPAEIDTALMVEAVIKRGAVVCVAEGCDRTVGLEWDHRRPFAQGGPTSAENLQALCRFHHSQKSAGRGSSSQVATGERGPPGAERNS